MAKVSSSARATSNSKGQSAAQAPPSASAPVSRSTRAQSREAVESVATTRRSTRAAVRAGSVEADHQAIPPRRGRARDTATDAPADIPFLTPVNEVSDAEEVEGEEEGDDEDEDEDEIRVRSSVYRDARPAYRPEQSVSRQSMGGLSAVSGTTAKTTFSVEEIGQLDKDVMSDAFGPLSSATDSLLRLVLPPDLQTRKQVWKDIAIENSRNRKLFLHRLKQFQVQMKVLTTQHYIQPSIVLRVLLGVPSIDDIPDGKWRPDPLMFKANLFLMLNALVLQDHSHSLDTNEFCDLLKTVEESFPTAIAGGESNNGAIDLSVALTAQVAITRMSLLAHEQQFSPIGIASSTLMTENEDGEPLYRYWYAFKMDDLRPEQQTAYKAMITQLANELKEPFDPTSGLSSDEAVNELRKQHPWSAFIATLLDYVEARRLELDRRTQYAGGAEAIADAVTAELQRRSEIARAEQIRRNMLHNPQTPSRIPPIASTQALKKSLSTRTTLATQMPAPTAQMKRPDTTVPVIDPKLIAPASNDGIFMVDDIDHPEQLLPTTARSPHQTLGGRLVVGKGPGDAQTNNRASASPFVARASSAIAGPSANIDPQLHQRPNKRPREEDQDGYEEIDPSQDGGFERDDRNISVADKRDRLTRMPVAQPQRRPAQPPTSQFEPSSEPDAPINQRPSNRAQLEEQNVQAVLADFPDPPGASATPDGDYLTQAKISVQSQRSTQARPPQARLAWTPTEEAALQELIGTSEGRVSYTKLKKEDKVRAGGPRLHNRSAEDMRFKARNLKVLFLSSRVPGHPQGYLPPGFDLVILAKKEIDLVHSRGIYFEQPRTRRGRGQDNEDEDE